MEETLKRNRSTQGRENTFAELVQRAEEVAPGIMELLKAYGGYEQDLQMVRYYLSLIEPQLLVSTSNRSQ